MPARYRKSINLGGGVKLNLNKKSTSLSVGGKGAHYTISSTGRRTKSVGVPGTGLSYRAASNATNKPRAGAGPKQRSGTAGAPKPGLFAPKGEKLLFKAMMLAADQGPPEKWMPLVDQAATFPRFAPAAHTIGGMFGASLAPDWALAHLAAVYATHYAPDQDPSITGYIDRAGMVFDIHGLPVTVHLSQQLLGFILIHLHLERGETDLALSVAQHMPHDPVSQLAQADLALNASQPSVAVTATDGLSNTDDITGLALALRAAALRALGHDQATVETAREALRYPSRATAVLRRARLERGLAYTALGQNARARADLERLLADDSTYPGLDHALAQVAPKA